MGKADRLTNKISECQRELKKLQQKCSHKKKEIKFINLNEGIDLHSHVVLVKSQLERFKNDLNAKRGGSFDTDSYEYEQDRWKNNSKMSKARDKKLGQWEKKVNKALNNLMNDYLKSCN